MTKNVEFATFTQTVMIRNVFWKFPKYRVSSKAGSGINILYLLTGPIIDTVRQSYTRLRACMH